MYTSTRLLRASYALGLLVLVSLLARPGPSSGQFRRGNVPPPAILPLNNLNTDSTGNFGMAGLGGLGTFMGFPPMGAFNGLNSFAGGFNGFA